MRHALAFVTVICVLCACAQPGLVTPDVDTPDTATHQRIVFVGEIATEGERQACETAGGEVRRDGLAGWEQCIQPFADAGQACTDSDQCLGMCLAGDMTNAEDGPVTGACQANDSPFGCYQEVQEGAVSIGICVD